MFFAILPPSVNFNPRAPRGARLTHSTSMIWARSFQSTCPARGTTITNPPADYDVNPISIHVPREGHDRFQSMLRGFIPKISIHVPREGHDPQADPHRQRGYKISIHVPREGHDADCGSIISARQQFQSTCPARGTTLFMRSLIMLSLRHFNPRAPRGARPSNYHQDSKRPRISIHVPREGHDCKPNTIR